MKITGEPFSCNLFRGKNDLNYLSIQLRTKDKKIWKVRLGLIEPILAQVNLMQIFESPELDIMTNDTFEGKK